MTVTKAYKCVGIQLTDEQGLEVYEMTLSKPKYSEEQVNYLVEHGHLISKEFAPRETLTLTLPTMEGFKIGDAVEITISSTSPVETTY